MEFGLSSLLLRSRDKSRVRRKTATIRSNINYSYYKMIWRR
jgi:hypothetical protein